VAAQLAYPVKVEAQLSDDLSRWLWLFKWALAIPHYFVLAFLWTAFALLSVIAFFSIVFTGRYPRSIFEFNVGVLRWSWRVAYYSYGALGTDRYPPFTLSEVDDYPVTLTIDYPAKLSRGLVLVKWWLLAIPHYIVVGLLIGGAWLTVRGDDLEMIGFGLIGILTLVAGVTLAFTGRYPTGLFDLVLGLNRWVIRVAAYAGLMTDAYPPFRLDLGGQEPGSSITLPASPPPSSSGTAAVGKSIGWTGGAILSVVLGSLFGLTSLGLVTGGGLVLWVDQTQREGGFVTSPTLDLSTDAYALVTESMELHVDGPNWLLPEAILGDARVRVDGTDEIFVGIGHTSDVQRYLMGVSYSFLPDLYTFDGLDLAAGPGKAPVARPESQDFWVVSSAGDEPQSIRWPVENGAWSLVVMNADGDAGVNIEGDIGAEAPILDAVGYGLLGVGAVLLLIAIAMIRSAINRAGRAVARGEVS
jgi:hypothetical protein